MKKTEVKKIFCSILVFIFVLGVNGLAFASIPNNYFDSEFQITQAQYNNYMNALNQYDLSTMNSQDVSPVTLSNDMFDKAYAYGWTGGSGGNNYIWKTYMKIPLTIPEHKAADAIYVSFYYKAKSSFELGGKQYTCCASNAVNHIRDSKERLFNLQSGGLGDFTFVCDDTWHKVELYTSGDRFADNSITIYNTSNLTSPFCYLISDLKVGVLSVTDASFVNDKAYTELGWVMQENRTPTTLIVNGNKTTITSDVDEYTVNVDEFENPDIKLEENECIVEKISDNEYKVTPIAYGYNKAVSDDQNVTYRERGFDSGKGYFVYNSGDIRTIQVLNSSLKGNSIIVNLQYEEGFYVDGTMVDKENIENGTNYVYKTNIAKQNNNEIVALFAAYEKDTEKLVDIVAYPYQFKDQQKVANIKLELNKTNEEDSLYFKVFVFDSVSNIMPLFDSLQTASTSAK